jgi:hypothetical protein
MDAELEILLALFPETVLSSQTAHSVDATVPLSVPPNPARASLLFSLSSTAAVSRVRVERFFGLDDSASRTFVASVAASAADLPDEGAAAALAAAALESLREAGDRAVCVVCLDPCAWDASLLQCGHGPVHAVCLSRWWSTLSEARAAAPESVRIRQSAAQARAAARARAADESRAALVAADAARAADTRCEQLSAWLAAAEAAAARGSSAPAGAPALTGTAARRARKEATRSATVDEGALPAAELASLLRTASSLRDRAVADAAAAAARSARTEAAADAAGGADGADDTAPHAASINDVAAQFPCPVCRAAVPTPLGVKIGAEHLPSASVSVDTHRTEELPHDVLSYLASARRTITAVYERQRERGGLNSSTTP